ncbi:MAG: peptidase M28 family protein [Bacteroidetes bacterium]|nr:MAG: peptidase M28 family protein [Bacteroidota bacterium]REK05834.1 MAG: peptidase M28 family protein [Bacteroidota bacterium]REK32030.1 MAG: peptidase M28 family protein [Bacteroidota bacterium]REK50094.1 MAG: peptidase M28 family protein [Bacteroidota bacterium]
MRYGLFIIFFLSCFNVKSQHLDSLALRKIYTEILKNGKGHEWLRELCKDIGPRLSGSPGAEQAVQWAFQKFKEAGADTVWLQEVTVPRWVRGKKETGRIIDGSNKVQEIPTLALGNSVSTPDGGITAPLIEIRQMEDLALLGEEKIKGKIVFFNHPMDETSINTFGSYSSAGKYRWSGPSEAARYGAVASICRSVSLSVNDYPHTGAMRYNDSLPKIPCATISTAAANLLGKILKSDKNVKFHLEMHCQMMDSVLSYNVIAEIRGTLFPDEIITAGAHLDAWDNGEGAHDDGAGIVQCMEVIRTMKNLGIKPIRTIRAVAFMNEENGLRGGNVYAEEAKRKNEKHVAAIESDAGGFTPYGFGLDMDDQKRKKIQSWAPLFRNYKVWNFDYQYGGADITPLKRLLGTPVIGMAVDSQRYFDVHHASSDTFEKVNKRELLLGAAAMTALTYLLSYHGL